MKKRIVLLLLLALVSGILTLFIEITIMQSSQNPALLKGQLLIAGVVAIAVLIAGGIYLKKISST
jgi:hypothetical protein